MQGSTTTTTLTERAQEQSGARVSQGGAPVELPELNFVYPLPGFEGLKRFVLVRFDEQGESDATSIPEQRSTDSQPGLPGPEAVLFELRSIEAPDIKFVVGVPGVFFPGYRVELDDSTCIDLGLTDSKDALTFVIMSMGTNTHAPHANLLAPIVVNKQNRMAAQIILNDTGWSIRAKVEQTEAD